MYQYDYQQPSINYNIPQPSVIQNDSQLLEKAEPPKAKTIQLVYRNKLTQKLQLNVEFFQILNQYTSKQVAFVSIYGTKSSGKSYLIDKIIQFTGYKGNFFSKQGQTQGIWMWSLPIVLQDQSVIFILGREIQQDCEHMKNNQKDDDMMIFIYLLSSCIIYNQKYREQEKNRFKQLTERARQNIISSQQVNIFNQKIDKPSLIILIRDYQSNLTSFFKKHIVSFSEEYDLQKEIQVPPPFSRTDKKFNDLPLNNLQKGFFEKIKSIYNLIKSQKSKAFCDIKLNTNMIQIMAEVYIDLINRTGKVDMSKAWDHMLKQLYISSYNYSILSFTQKLKQQLKDDKPFSSEQLHSLIKQNILFILQKYNEYNIMRDGKQHYNNYYNKLIDFLNHKQKLIYNINMYKSNKENKQKIRQLIKNNVKYNDQNFSPQNQELDFCFKKLVTVMAEYNDSRLDCGQTKQFILEIKQTLYSILKTYSNSKPLKNQNEYLMIKKEKQKYIYQQNEIEKKKQALFDQFEKERMELQKKKSQRQQQLKLENNTFQKNISELQNLIMEKSEEKQILKNQILKNKTQIKMIKQNRQKEEKEIKEKEFKKNQIEKMFEIQKKKIQTLQVKKNNLQQQLNQKKKKQIIKKKGCFG